MFAAAAAMALAACGGSGAGTTGDGGDAAGDGDNDRITVGVPSFYSDSALPWRFITPDQQIWGGVYDKLVYQAHDSYEVEPGLAESWEVSPDGTVYTFHLRQGIQFHKGYGELTSEDVKFTMEQMIDPANTGGSNGVYRTLVQSVEAPDPYTVVVRTIPTWQLLESMMSSFVVASKKHIEEVGVDAANLNPVGTGPYEFVSGGGDRFEFKALPEHWRKTAEFERLLVRRIPDPSTLLSAIRAGEVDIAPLGGDQVRTAESAGLKIWVNEKIQAIGAVLPGMSMPGTADYCPECPWVGDRTDPSSESYERAVKVRKALAMAIDKEAIVEAVFAGYGSTDPIGYYSIPGKTEFPESFAVLPYDPEGARELLEEAGYGDGLGRPLPVTGHPLTIDSIPVMQAVAQYWEAIGIDAPFQTVDLSVQSEYVRARDPRMNTFFHTYSRSPSSIATNLISTGGFRLLVHDPVVDEKVKEIIGTISEEERAPLVESLVEQLVEDETAPRIAWRDGTYVSTDKLDDWSMQFGSYNVLNHEYMSPA